MKILNLVSHYFLRTSTNKNRNTFITNTLRRKIDGGQGGIRTLGTVASTHTFQACSFDHSDTCPFVGSGRSLGGMGADDKTNL